MKALLLTLLHLAVMTATLCGRGGVRAVIAENLLLCVSNSKFSGAADYLHTTGWEFETHRRTTAGAGPRWPIAPGTAGHARQQWRAPLPSSVSEVEIAASVDE